MDKRRFRFQIILNLDGSRILSCSLCRFTLLHRDSLAHTMYILLNSCLLKYDSCFVSEKEKKEKSFLFLIYYLLSLSLSYVRKFASG